MTRHIGTAMLLGALMFAWTAEAPAQMMQPQVFPGIVGSYVNLSTGRAANVYRSGTGYLFVDENGLSAYFRHATASRLEMVSGAWAPTVVRIQRAGAGRALLRFDSADSWGYWRQVR